MARKFILQNLIKLAQNIGANPSKLAGTRTNISFLGTGPTKNPMFQGPVLGIEAEIALGKPSKRVISAIEDALGYAQDNKLNPIQLEALTLNMEKLNKALNPPVLPMATVSQFPKQDSGIMRAMKRHQDILKGAETEIKQPLWKELGFASLKDFHRVEASMGNPISKKFLRSVDPSIQQFNKDLSTRLGVTAMLDQKTGMSRAIARQILQQDTRLNLPDEVLISLRTGSKGADPLDLMRKYYGESMLKYDDFLNQVNIEAASPSEFADMVLKHVKLVPQFASGGLARILEV